MSTPHIIVRAAALSPCITIIGMAGAGKSTVGKALARHLNWAFADTDHIIEATYAAKLQNVADSLSKDEFLDAEASIVQSCFFNRTVIATGGSVVYREKTMEHLANLGICELLYQKYANIILDAKTMSPKDCVLTLMDLFPKDFLQYFKN